MRKFLAGIKLTIPIETIQKAFAGAFQGPDMVCIKMGAKYALAGEWWSVAGIDEKGIRLEPLEARTRVVEVGK